ncbi:MAG TPA: single-stranded DNA-binding protein [Candidatus Binataceae bacterium]|nr:single-stranded DNA-binding protein [Candidatus Binataceae bacterium]
MGNRIELSGRLVDEPELRTTPGGTPVLKLVVDCGLEPERLRLGVVMAGEGGREAAAMLRRGGVVRVKGRLRAVAQRPRGAGSAVEVIASGIEPQDEK